MVPPRELACLLRERTYDFCGDVQEEDGCNEGEGEDKNDKWVSVELEKFRKPNSTTRHQDIDVRRSAKVRNGI